MSRVAVREAVSECLKAVLSASSEEARRAAEQEMKALEVTEEYGVVLAQLTAAREVSVAYRQLGGVLLRQYLDSHWSELSEKFAEPVASEESKREIRELLLATLGDSEKKLRATAAYCVSVIAHWDWPEAWPNLLPRLDASLGSGNASLVHGAMRVLIEFCRDISDMQVPYVAPVILPQLLKVLVQPQVYGVKTQSRAVHVFHSLACIVYSASETSSHLVTSLLLPALPQFVEVFISLLSTREAWAADPGLRRELLMTVSSLLSWFPAPMATYVMDLVAPVWDIFLANTPLYVTGVVNCEGVKSEECDSDGELVTIETCVFAVFEFISGLVESVQLRSLLPPILPTLAVHLISHMQPTHSQVESWLADVAQFVDEEEQVFSYSVRLSAHDLLLAMWEEPALRDHTHSAITSAVERHLQSSRESGSPNAWKVQEACLLALSCVAVAHHSSFSAQQFTETVLLPILDCPAGHPLLLGRCLWLAGKMAAQLKPNTVHRLLQFLETALLPTQQPVLRLLAAKATYYFCSELQESSSLLRPMLPSLISILANMTTNSQDVVLLVVIDTLQLVAAVDDEVTAEHAQQLSQVALTLFLKYSHDPGISSSLEDLFSVLAGNTGCHTSLHSLFLPSAVQLLDCSVASQSLGLVPAVLEVLVRLVRGCGEGKVPAEVVREVFPRVVRVGVASDDVSLLQNAGECVRAFVSMAMEQLVQWSDSEGESGVLYVVRLAVHLLDPSRPESSAAFIGRLLIVFIKKAGSVLGESLQLMLRSVLSKMRSVKTATVMQSLLMVYAYLLYTELEPVVSFLSQVPDARGQPALQYVVQEWTSQHSFFFGLYETRLSTAALCRLLSHCVSTGDQLLCGLLVEEEVEGIGEGVRTRSQKAAAAGSVQRRAIPLPAKIVHLLVSDLQSYLEAAAASEEGSECSEDEGEMETLLVAEDGQWEEGPEEDPDLMADSLLQLDMQAQLVKSLQEVSQLASSSSVWAYLRPSELAILNSFGILCT